MKTKRMISLLLAVLLTLSVAVTPAFAASAGDLLPAAESADVEESNDVVSIRLTTSGELVYGSPFTLSVVTKPADTQYIGVIIGTKGDKLSRNDLKKNLMQMKKLFPTAALPLAYSSLTGEGRDALLEVIERKICE